MRIKKHWTDYVMSVRKSYKAQRNFPAFQCEESIFRLASLPGCQVAVLQIDHLFDGSCHDNANGPVQSLGVLQLLPAVN